MVHKEIGVMMKQINEDMEDQLNEIGGKLEQMQSIMRALNSALYGSDELEERDAYSMADLLTEKFNETMVKYAKLISELKI